MVWEAGAQKLKPLGTQTAGNINPRLLYSVPIIVAGIFDLPQSVQIGGTSLIIVVGVAIETYKQIKQKSQEKEYHGFLD